MNEERCANCGKVLEGEVIRVIYNNGDVAYFCELACCIGKGITDELEKDKVDKDGLRMV